MVDASLRVDFRLIGARSESELGADKNVEIIVGCMSACVAFGANCGALKTVRDMVGGRGREANQR
jgi:hypothetical protein